MRVTHNVLAATALSLVISACASGPGGAGHQRGMQHEGAIMHGGGAMMSMGPMVGCPGSADSVDARLASLHATLLITGAQQALWTPYAEAYRRSVSSMGMGAMGAMSAMPLPERLQHHETMMSRHLASLRDLRAALAPLYASLSAEQRAIADAMVCDRPMPARS